MISTLECRPLLVSAKIHLPVIEMSAAPDRPDAESPLNELRRRRISRETMKSYVVFMGAAHGRRRDGLALGAVLAGILLAGRPCAFALNPALDVSQYAHTSWKVRDG